MKKRFFTSNIDIATVAACGGLTLMPMFLLFMETHGLRYSLVALFITLWGFLSLKHRDTKQDAPKPKKQRWRKIGTAIALIVFISGGLLFGAIKMIDATQTDITPCPERTWKDCPIKERQQPPCPHGQRKSRCTLDAAAQSKQLFKFEKEDGNE